MQFDTSKDDSSQDDDDNRYEAEREQLIREQKVMDKLLAGSGQCCICGNIDPLVLEEHHIAGRKHSDLTITLCANCHLKISRKQRSYPRKWLETHLSPLSCIAFTLMGMADILSAVVNFLREHEERKEGEEGSQ